MKVMVMLKGAGADESRIASTRAMLAMGDYNDRLVKAGIVLDGAGLKPSSEGGAAGLRGRYHLGCGRPIHRGEGDHRRLLDLAGELGRGGRGVGQAVPIDPRGLGRLLEIRPYEDEDFGEEDMPELRQGDAKLAEEIRAQHGKG